VVTDQLLRVSALARETEEGTRSTVPTLTARISKMICDENVLVLLLPT
jgi:hypothetical protein